MIVIMIVTMMMVMIMITIMMNSPGTLPRQELRGSIGWSMSAKSFANLLLRRPATALSKYDHDDRDFYLAMADDDDGDDQGQDDEGGEDADGDHRARVHLPILLPVQRPPSFYVPDHEDFYLIILIILSLELLNSWPF